MPSPALAAAASRAQTCGLSVLRPCLCLLRVRVRLSPLFCNGPQSLDSGPTRLQHDLLLAHYIRKDPASK